MFLTAILAVTPTFAPCPILNLPDSADSWKGYCAMFGTELVQIAFPGVPTQTNSSTTVTLSQTDGGVTYTLICNYPVSTPANSNTYFEQQRAAATASSALLLTYNLNQNAPLGSLATLFTTKDVTTNIWTQYYIRISPQNTYHLNISYNPANYTFFQIGTFALFRSIFTVTIP